jgi:hypothetical protein
MSSYTPRVPPGLGHGTIVPELIQTNRMLIADLRETQEHVRALQHQTMAYEENRARMQARDAEVARQRHEAAMALIRQNINPDAGLMEAMYPRSCVGDAGRTPGRACRRRELRSTTPWPPRPGTCSLDPSRQGGTGDGERIGTTAAASASASPDGFAARRTSTFFP